MIPIVEARLSIGDLNIPCDGEYFLASSGVKFVPELKNENDLQNFGISSDSEDGGEVLRNKNEFSGKVKSPHLTFSDSSF